MKNPEEIFSFISLGTACTSFGLASIEK